MRYIRYAVLAVIGLCLLVMALANRTVVTLNLLPADLAVFSPLPNSISLPLYAVVFGGIVLGLAFGFLREWVREHKHRATAVSAQKDCARLERELKKARRNDTGTSADDVLALLDGPAKS